MKLCAVIAALMALRRKRRQSEAASGELVRGRCPLEWPTL